MEEKNNNMSELVKLMHKTGRAMEMTREKQSSIDTLKSDIMEEVRPMMVEKMKEDIKLSENGKKEFDEMTKNAMIEAKTNILQIRETSEKEYQDKLTQFAQKTKRIEEKLASMKNKELPIEKMEMAEKAAKNALDKEKDEMKKFQDNHFIKRAKLDEFDRNISDWAIELGVKDEIDNVKLETEPKTTEPKTTEPKTAEPKTAEPKTAEPKTAEPKTTEPKTAEPKTAEPKTTEPKTTEPKTAEPKTSGTKKAPNPNLTKYDYKKIYSIDVADKKYRVTYEIKQNGKVTTKTEEVSKLGFFKALKQKINLAKERKSFGINVLEAMKTDGNIVNILNDKSLRPEDKKMYLNYLTGKSAECFDINYDKNNRFARALGKGQKKLRLNEAKNREDFEAQIKQPNNERNEFLTELKNYEPMTPAEHAKEEAKLNELFKTGKIASEEPEKTASKKRKKTIKKSKKGKFCGKGIKLFGGRNGKYMKDRHESKKKTSGKESDRDER